MLVVISDLHFQDTKNDAIYDESKPFIPADRNVPTDAFKKVFDDIMITAKDNDAKELIIVLAGDIFDLNRSQKWFEGDVRPYGDSKDRGWKPLIQHILKDIIESNDDTFKLFKKTALQTLENGGQIVFEYLPGNHDRLINLDGDLRKSVRTELLGRLDQSDAEFDHVYRSNKYGVLIRHGHEYDQYNFAGNIPQEGEFKVDPADYARAPLGDYVTIDIAVGLAYEYRKLNEKEIKSGEHPFQSIYSKLLEFDDLRPQSDLIDFLQAKTTAGVDVWKQITPAADTVVKRALESKFLRTKLGMLGKVIPLVKWILLRLPTKLLPTKFIIKHISTMHSDGPEPWQYVLREKELGGDTRRYVAAGHTHSPTVEFLRHHDADGKEFFFFDTGTWRQQIRKCRDCQDSATFARAKALTYVAFYSSDEDRKNMTGNKGYSFDYWSGFTKKEGTI
ncbi:MAG TPA: metallophosphoesterase [Syntrophales bacterium]|nr:metallophosphoesterase [Syntrophales bacterium]